MKKIKSIIKKASNLHISAVFEGVKAKSSGKNTDLAKHRSKICAECELIEDEPIDELAIKDSIQSISGKICGDCACALPFMLRQKVKSCPLGKW